MLTTILTSIAIFIATGIDEIIVLTIIFVEVKKPKDVRDVYIGQQISMIVLLLISLLAVFGFAQIPSEYVGFLGIIPLAEGVRILLNKNSDDDDYQEKDVLEKLRKSKSLIISIALIAIAGGAEELSIYIPYFTSLDTTNLIVALIIFNVLVPIWCTICRKISSLKHVQDTVEKHERILVPILFIGLGIWVLIENGTWDLILRILR